MPSRSNSLRKLFRALLVACLAGCGGGGGDGASPSGATSSPALNTAVPRTRESVAAWPSPPPVNGARAVATYESLGLYWTPATTPSAEGCSVIFRRVGDATFRQGLNLWYDARNNECRGSLVLLDPGTSYEVQIGLAGQSPIAGVTAATWQETDQLPIAQTITLPAGTRSTPLAITQGGNASGYLVYQADPASGTTIDVQNQSLNNVTIAASFVILRGFKLQGAQADAINLLAGAHDLVIEKNDISGWGRYRATGSWDYGVDYDAGVRCESVSTLERVTVQRNKIHDPRYGANSWDSAHPARPQGMSFNFCGGNNVIRYNEVTSADFHHYFNDGIGGSDNFTTPGFPNYDSDIYGNVVQGAMDDGLGIEGADRNVRISNNFLTQTGTGIASTVDSVGPLYIFRNGYDRNRMHYLSSLDSDDRGPFFKSGSQDSTIGDGRRYVFHNTSLQARDPSAANVLGASGGVQGTGIAPMTDTVSRNNIFWIWKPSYTSVEQRSGGHDNDVDYDLYNGGILADPGAEANGIKVAAPTFAAGNGAGMSGMYQLQPGTPGYGMGVRIANFNDQFPAPDIRP